MDDLSRIRIDRAKLPIWLRIVIVVLLALLAADASQFVYRWYVRPVTLSIAVGSVDGDAPKIISALASRLAVNNALVRLKVVETSGPIESGNAFSSGKTDLAVVRGDVGDLSQARAIVVLGPGCGAAGCTARIADHGYGYPYRDTSKDGARSAILE